MSTISFTLAYIDPATGSVLVQVLLAGLAAAAVGFERFKQALGRVFGKKKPVEPKEEQTEDKVDEASREDS